MESLAEGIAAAHIGTGVVVARLKSREELDARDFLVSQGAGRWQQAQKQGREKAISGSAEAEARSNLNATPHGELPPPQPVLTMARPQ